MQEGAAVLSGLRHKKPDGPTASRAACGRTVQDGTSVPYAGTRCRPMGSESHASGMGMKSRSGRGSLSKRRSCGPLHAVWWLSLRYVAPSVVCAQMPAVRELGNCTQTRHDIQVGVTRGFVGAGQMVSAPHLPWPDEWLGCESTARRSPIGTSRKTCLSGALGQRRTQAGTAREAMVNQHIG